MPHVVVTPSRASLHGEWRADLDPVARVAPGDHLEFRDLLDVAWGRGQHDRANRTRDKWGPRESPRDDGIALHGPVYVEGLRAGDTLALHVEDVRTGTYGWTWSGTTPLNAALNTALGVRELGDLLLWELDADAGSAVSERGHRAALRPFPGTIGLCPGGAGPHTSWHPGRTGGNMDCRFVHAGATLYLPVEVDGGLLSVGDGHAAQGDGELPGTAIECRLARLLLHVQREEVLRIEGPTIRLPDGRWVTLGFGESLDDALHTAAGNMLRLMTQVLGCDLREALLLSGTFVDLGITQAVNGVRGIHAVLRPPERATT